MVVIGCIAASCRGAGGRHAAADPPPSRPPEPSTLLVDAAASLAAPFQELADTLQRRTPGLRVELNLAGSQILATQIVQGAPVDVFASADHRVMDQVAHAGAIAGPTTVFARNVMVIVTPPGNPADIHDAFDLARAGVSLVLADDPVPAGHYAREALAKVAMLPNAPTRYYARIMRNVMSNENNVELVLAKIRLNSADAGIVYQSDAARAGAAVRVVAFPPSAQSSAEYVIASLGHARAADHAHAADAFVALVQSPQGQAILRRHGFIAVGATR